jgi:hypothetical protein
VFSSTLHTSYAEIYRHRTSTALQWHAFPMSPMPPSTGGICFNTLDGDAFVCCTQVARQLYRDLGCRAGGVQRHRQPRVRDTMTRPATPTSAVLPASRSCAELFGRRLGQRPVRETGGASW